MELFGTWTQPAGSVWVAVPRGSRDTGGTSRGVFEFVNPKGRFWPRSPFCFLFLRQPNKCECKQTRSINTVLSISSRFLSHSNACILNRICWHTKKSLNFGRKFNVKTRKNFAFAVFAKYTKPDKLYRNV